MACCCWLWCRCLARLSRCCPAFATQANFGPSCCSAARCIRRWSWCCFGCRCISLYEDRKRHRGPRRRLDPTRPHSPRNPHFHTIRSAVRCRGARISASSPDAGNSLPISNRRTCCMRCLSEACSRTPSSRSARCIDCHGGAGRCVCATGPELADRRRSRHPSWRCQGNGPCRRSRVHQSATAAAALRQGPARRLSGCGRGLGGLLLRRGRRGPIGGRSNSMRRRRCSIRRRRWRRKRRSSTTGLAPT